MLLKTADTRRGYHAKVADFGTARALGRQQRVQSEKYGTVTHCPPELLLEGTFSKVRGQLQRRLNFRVQGFVGNVQHRHPLPARAAAGGHLQQGA